MGRTSKYSLEEKLKIVEECLNGCDNPNHVMTSQGINERTVRRWIAKYKAEGASAFLIPEKNRRYSSELKKQVVEEYLSGKSSALELMSKYAIRGLNQIYEWVKIYNNRGYFKEIVEGGSYTVKARSTTQEERLAIVKDCIENGLTYSEAALKYQVSYQQVYQWTRKFKAMGAVGLEDRRGKRLKDQHPRTREEELEIEIAKLKHELYMTKMERDVLKKLDEIVRRDAYRK